MGFPLLRSADTLVRMSTRVRKVRIVDVNSNAESSVRADKSVRAPCVGVTP